MQAINYGLRKPSPVPGAGAYGRHNIPSSIYSGPGPVDEDLQSESQYTPVPNGMRETYRESQPRYNPVRWSMAY